ncbi:MAG: tetratricopeptide repeat protein, partial [Terriglobales bacterium]
MSVRSLILGLLLLAPVASPAQISIPSTRTAEMVELRVSLNFGDGSSISSPASGSIAGVTATTRGGGGRPGLGGDSASSLQIRVQLQDGFGDVVDERNPDRQGLVTFRVRNGSTYRLRVFGPEIEETWVERVEPNRGDRYMSVTLQRKGVKPILASPSTATVPAIRLAIPSNAQKEFDKGAEALADGNLKKARQQFEKAIELYPQYDQAYNNLGVVYMQSEQPDEGRKAFEKALALNDSFSRAYINLAKIELGAKNFARANQLLQKALVGDPLNPQGLFLGVQAGVFSGQPDVA